MAFKGYQSFLRRTPSLRHPVYYAHNTCSTVAKELQIKGAIAALITPRTDRGGVDWKAFEAICRFTIERGVTGLVVGGGTGEYASLSLEDRNRLADIAIAAVKGSGLVIVGCGGSRLDQSVELARTAFASGADAVLVPPPHFYRYSQEDLEGFYVEAARQIHGPVLLYNLASFVTPMQPATMLRLLRAVENLVGVKDSSGDLNTLEALTDRPDLPGARILGHDRVLVEALRRKLIDASISGLASVAPEITVAAFNAADTGDDVRLEALGTLLDEFLERVAALPYPWALTEIAAARDVCAPSYPFPPTDSRRQALDAVREWLPNWLDRLSTVNLSRL